MIRGRTRYWTTEDLRGLQPSAAARETFTVWGESWAAKRASDYPAIPERNRNGFCS